MSDLNRDVGDDPLGRAHAAPKFAAPDPCAAAEWYRDHLGFPEITLFEEAQYAIVRRGDFTLHFWACQDRHIAENTACYVELATTDDLDSLHAEFFGRAKHTGFAPGRVQTAPIDALSHGMREFHVWDPAGNLIGFGARL